MSVVTISAHAHASTHSDEACGRPAAARHNSRQQLERSATLTAPASQQHVIRSSFLPTSASVLRTFGTFGHFAVLPKEQPHRATRANVPPNSPKSCQTKWFQTFQAGFTSLLIRKQPQSACAHQRFSARSPDDGQQIIKNIRACRREKLHKPRIQITLPDTHPQAASFALYRESLRRLFCLSHQR